MAKGKGKKSSPTKQIAGEKQVEQVTEEEEEEDVVDPMDTVREGCKSHCTKYQETLESCNDRVNSRKQTDETCHEEVIHLFHCIDHCATGTLMTKMK